MVQQALVAVAHAFLQSLTGSFYKFYHDPAVRELRAVLLQLRRLPLTGVQHRRLVILEQELQKLLDVAKTLSRLRVSPPAPKLMVLLYRFTEAWLAAASATALLELSLSVGKEN